MPCRVFTHDNRDLVFSEDYDEVSALLASGWVGTIRLSDASGVSTLIDVETIVAVQPSSDRE